MTDFNLEQCKNLAKWGMPQELEAGDWYYQQSLTNKGPGWVAFLHDTNRLLYPDRVKIPSLDELMEFAKTLDMHWSLIPCDAGWVVSSIWSGEHFKPVNANPKLAVYALIEKLKMR